MKTAYYVKRMWQLGPTGVALALKKQVVKKQFSSQWKQKALTEQARHSWEKIASKQHSFSDFFNKLKQNVFLNDIYTSELFKQHLPADYQNKKKIISHANKATENTFDILGSGNYRFKNNIIQWHHDFKSPGQSTFQHLSKTFYQDIALAPPEKSTIGDYFPDIKVPWELSRFQHIFWLGKAYQTTHDNNYAHVFKEQVSDWIQKNQYLLGVNWVCPMEVAIRAINWIWGLYFFKDADIPLSFWNELICSLYDHAVYLENNWETSDKPNNHYLSNLIGYYYLCHLFEPLDSFSKKLAWCYKKIIQQCHKQILPDGTCYEGSTAYHRLDTEIILHATALTQTQNKFSSTLLKQKLNKMFNFLQDSTNQNGNLVHIGDNDSGKLVTGLHVQPCKNSSISKQYPNFGLSIINEKSWHITLRHPTFSHTQPTGHFHNDHLSITLSIGQHQVLVDPGTYVYTANPTMRNLMRAHAHHNTFFVPHVDYLENQDLFQLNRQHCKQTASIAANNAQVCIEDSYHGNFQEKIQLHRKLIFKKQEKKLILNDWIEKNSSDPRPISWTFLCAPSISLLKKVSGTWNMCVNSKPIALFCSDLPFTQGLGYYASSYGSMQKTVKLTAAIHAKPGEIYTTTITGIAPTMRLHDQEDPDL